MKHTSAKWWRIAYAAMATHLLFAAATWPTLPARIPTHFNLHGQADAWGEPAFLLWFGLFIVECGLAAMLRFLSNPRAKDLWNIPEKNAFLKLSEVKQAPVVRLVDKMGGMTMVALTVSFFAVQLMMYLTANGYLHGMPQIWIAAVLAPHAVLLASLVPWSRAVKSAILNGAVEGNVGNHG